MDGNSSGTVQSMDGGNAVVVSGGKLYNVPLSALYAHGTDTAKGLVSKVPQAQLEAHTAAGAGASADTDSEADPGSRSGRSNLPTANAPSGRTKAPGPPPRRLFLLIGRRSVRARVGKYGMILGVAVSIK